MRTERVFARASRAGVRPWGAGAGCPVRARYGSSKKGSFSTRPVLPLFGFVNLLLGERVAPYRVLRTQTVAFGSSVSRAPRAPLGCGDPVPHKPFPLHASRCRNPELPSGNVPLRRFRQTRPLTPIGELHEPVADGEAGEEHDLDPL